MTAKEMFEELELKLVNKYDNAICYEYKHNERVKYKECIDFYLIGETISLYVIFSNGTYGSFNGIDTKLLQAINRQVEELGWNDENNK